MISLFFIACLICLAYPASGKPNGWAISSVCVLIAVAAAGLRVGGFDYDDYITTIDILRDTFEREVELEIRILIAKDPMMLALADLSQYVSLDPYRSVFLGFAALGLAPKLLASFTLRQWGPIFIGAYLLLMSPGLEFAAIRAATGIGFLLLAAVLYRKALLKAILGLIAIASHLSLIPFVVALPFSRRLAMQRMAFIAIAATAAGSYLLSGLIGEFDRGEAFARNAGTLGALLFPVATLLVFALQLAGTDRNRSLLSGVIAPNLGASIGLALPSVTISFRLLEVCWALMLFSLLSDSKEKRWTNTNIQFLSISLFVAILAASNLTRSTWSAILFRISY